MNDPAMRRGRLPRWLVPQRGGWLRMCLRLALAACLLLGFRYHVLAGLIAGHNLIWKAITGSASNHPGDIQSLTRLRGPGLRMLVRLREEGALARVEDPDAIPALMRIAERHSSVRARVQAMGGLASFQDERIMDLAARSLLDPEPRVRLAAASMFSELGEERHVPLLERVLKNETNPLVHLVLEQTVAGVAPRAPGDSPQRTVRTAAIQFRSQFGRPAENRARLTRAVREAAGHGARIVVLPEAAISGYMTLDIRTGWLAAGHEPAKGVKGIPAATVAETVPGPSSVEFCRLAGELGIYLTIPVLEVERSSGKYFNTLCLAGPDGSLLLHYRKLNPWPYGERGWASAGDRGHAIAETPYGRLALLICYDINTEPERLKARDVDILLYSIAWVDRPKSPWFDVKLPRIARDNNMSIVGANWTIPEPCGWHGYGRSRIVDRTGRVLARAANDLAEEIVYADLPVGK